MARKSRDRKGVTYARVEITWVDAAHYQGWAEPDDSMSVLPKDCTSVGYLLTVDKKFVRLAQSLSGTDTPDAQIADVLAIPRVWVQSMKVLK